MKDCVANWEPLRLLLEDRSVGEFMFMGCADGPASVKVFLYKHFGNRAYLNLDASGRFYRYQAFRQSPASGSYTEISRADALAEFARSGWPLAVKDPRRFAN